MNKQFSLLTLFIFSTLIQTLNSQENSGSLSSSPYSLYGLGLFNDIGTGKTNTLGKTGIAMPSTTSINILNPASFGAIPKGSFLFDVGIKAERETLYKDGIADPKFNANFSNLAIAFPITKNSGFAFTLIPFTNVGYLITDIESGIDGSTDIFLTDINGSGGLNDIKLNYGYTINERLRLGLSGSYLFGKIKEEEINTINIDETILTISEESFYGGFRVGFGVQYDFNDHFTFGGTINLPTTLKGEQTRTSSVNGFELEASENDIDDFKLPLEFGFGLHAKLNEKLYFNLDYKKMFWSATNQTDFIGEFIDQDVIGFGAEFTPKKTSLKYWQRVEYRAGFNFDNGNLAIKDSRVTNYGINFGLGLPINTERHSYINLGYSYGQKGQITNGLIKENYHILTLNISLEDLWFQKRKYY